MPALKRFFPAIPAVILCLLLIPLISACGNNGVVAPAAADGPGWDALNPNPAPNDSNDRGDVTVDDDSDDGDNPGSDTISPTMDIPAGSIDDLASALVFLRESGGGILTSPLSEDQLMIHIWDAPSECNLPGEAVIACEGGLTSLVDVEGVALFENVTFPVTVTVKVDGYPMMTYAGTSGNVLSFPLERLPVTEPAHVFGIADTHGYSSMSIIGDSLIPDITWLAPSSTNSEYFQYRMEVPPGETLGFSAFLVGAFMIDDLDDGILVPMDGLLWMTNCFAWNLGPMNPGDQMFYTIPWAETIGPDDVAIGVAAMPGDLFASIEDTLDWNKFVLPVTAFIDEDRYLAVGPQSNLRGSDPSDITYSCPWFEPPEWGDRTVIAGIIETPAGAIDLVHADWDTGVDAPDIVFSGIPQIGVIDLVTEGHTMPYIGFINPLGADSDLVRIHVSAYGFRPVWDIVVAGDVLTVDTVDFSIPLTWLSERYGNHDILYQAECIDALSLDIDDFNEDQINMTRRETCFSEWVAPQQ
jgi:hypothetical protein